MDGIREQFTGGEPDFPGVMVRLYTCDGLLVGEQATNVSGNAAFFDLPAGEYFVEFIAPAGYAFTLQDQGANEEVDSDADTLTGRTVCFTLAAGAQEKRYDAGLYQVQTPVLASLGDFVWHDLNANGVQDAGELGVENVTVNLLDCAGNILATTTTNASGFYLFSGLMPGNFNVQFVLPSGYAFSPQNIGDDLFDSDADASGFTECTTLTAGENDLSWDAGIYMLPTNPGTGTPGYWKNHPEAWPVDSITIGGVVYTKAQALYWLDQKDGDKTVTLFRALVSAKLNGLIGNDSSCVASIISAADAWFAVYGPVGSKVKADSQAWKIGEPLYLMLDMYNNGGLCAPHRD
jgi:hypothetical protein